MEDVSRWHIPGATSTDRAREVARTCWQALRKVDPHAAELIAWAANEAGEAWLVPQLARHQPDDLISPVDAAELVGKSARTVYEWIARGRLPHTVGSDGRIRVHVATLLDFAASRRRNATDDA